MDAELDAAVLSMLLKHQYLHIPFLLGESKKILKYKLYFLCQCFLMTSQMV